MEYFHNEAAGVAVKVRVQDIEMCNCEGQNFRARDRLRGALITNGIFLTKKRYCISGINHVYICVYLDHLSSTPISIIIDCHCRYR